MARQTVPVAPVLPFQGDEVMATYRDPLIPAYRGNPLIEALPAILSEEEVLESLSYYPDYDEEHRAWPAHLRYHQIQNAVRFFQPLGKHLDIERRFSCMIRSGYVGRNPLDRAFWRNLQGATQEMGESGPVRRCNVPQGRGFAIIGVSGVGKTTAIQKTLLLYDQIINHKRYNEQDFSWRQVVWLKLECPGDGSMKSLCIDFFQTLDSILA